VVPLREDRSHHRQDVEDTRVEGDTHTADVVDNQGGAHSRAAVGSQGERGEASSLQLLAAGSPHEVQADDHMPVEAHKHRSLAVVDRRLVGRLVVAGNDLEPAVEH